MRRGLIMLLSLASIATAQESPIQVGSKSFTESVILGDMLQQIVESTGRTAEHQRELGGTRLLWNALLAGELDAYVEYTGTIEQEILAGKSVDGEQSMREHIEQVGLRMTEPLGFNNTYAIGVTADLAQRHGLSTISDLVAHPDLVFGFSNEFMERADGWPGLRKHYGLPQQEVSGLEHALAYRALDVGELDGTDFYSTDAEIDFYGFVALADDRAYFPTYHALIIYRADLETRAPDLVEAFHAMEGRIDAVAMARMNKRAKLDRVHERQVAADFLSKAFGTVAQIETLNLSQRLRKTTLEHLRLVGLSLLSAILIAVPFGILAARHRVLAQVVLGVSGVIQTIPAFALLALMIPLVGLGGPAAISALFLYSLLPIVRNTYTGLTDTPSHLRESALALGLPPMKRLRWIELPIASRAILAGIKTSAVINVGFATLGAFVGAGGYGQPILTGIRLANTGLILEGAIPAALLALAAQWFFEWSERFLVPAGLRLKSTD
ncbi:MAG TPA: glycine betaine ABC transporter substrate-binding protein [Candidatus Latescibacteria bacterium]|nr:amino acid ABC transporter permease [Gemmatimonadota bacterium]MDP7364829.1 glycine betaine ABC transporter substrate-binding protein [Candidatus Latescibacterota bacterium]HJN29091.1 glycine betaine ABC transporter substrate-binding protein [Candidatus Latescibacterota bacterium]